MEIVGLFSTWRAWSSKCGGTIGGREVRINGFPPNNSSTPPPTSHPLHKGRQAKKKVFLTMILKMHVVKAWRPLLARLDVGE